MKTDIKKVYFKKDLPIGFEIKDLAYVKHHPAYFRGSRKAAFYHIIWISSGEAVFDIDFCKVRVCKNELLVISSAQVYTFDIDSVYEGKMFLYTDSFFNHSETDTRFLYESETLNPIHLNRTIPVSPDFMNKIISLLLTEEKLSADIYHTYIIQNYLRIILLSIERYLSAKEVVPDTALNLTIARKFINQVEKYFSTNRHVEFYTNLLGVGEKVLARQVKALTGKTPKIYIDSRIVLEAKRMLAYGNLSVKEISFALGFDEPANFNKFFRKHTGIPPLIFRRSFLK